MAVLLSLQISGRTAASTLGTATGIVNSKSLTIDSDGFLRFTDANGQPRSFQLAGDIGVFIGELFTGTGGLAAGGAGVQGQRVFGNPRLAQ